ncbi:alpha/beta hydrolase-fold protein [Methylosoma difficile]
MRPYILCLCFYFAGFCFANAQPPDRLGQFRQARQGTPAWQSNRHNTDGGSTLSTQWVNSPDHRPGSENVGHFQFDSQAIGQPVGYSIYLPPSYAAGNQHYPVIYWLHGKTGNESRGAYLAKYLNDAIAQGILKETIMVFPNGGVDNFYTDAFDGGVKVESMIINELLPFIDKQYRTLANRENRALIGFSMGGFGALKFYCKYPEKFVAVETLGGAFIDKDNLPVRHEGHTFKSIFNNDFNFLQVNTPVYWCAKNRDELKKYHENIRLVIGDADFTRPFNDKMHDLLTSLSITHNYQVLNDVKHNPIEYYEHDDFGSFKFIAAALGK